MIQKLSEKICAWFHGGGDVKRDVQGRINWQCRKCGRWADPVSLETESRVIARELAGHTRGQS